MAELDPRPPAPLRMLTAPVHVKTAACFHSYLHAPDFPRLQEMVQQTLRGSSLAIARVDVLPDHLHTVNIIRLSNGSHLVLKAAPSPVILLLRHERYLLDNEAHALQILARSDLPIPRILKNDPTSMRLGSPFLLSTYLPGVPYAEVQKLMTLPERANVEHQLRFLIAAIGQHVPPVPETYGPLALVASDRGHKTWREAFREMLDSVLMDAEDSLINLPYAQIRTEVASLDDVLDDVREPRLVIIGLTERRNILIDRTTNNITGLLDFGVALWGDWQISVPDAAVGIKGQIYTIYHAVVTIVKNNFRRHNNDHELDARRDLIVALQHLTTSMKG
ncbi:MAG: hypothetical protein Q9209_006616 [Squamulea sp. 1 TL-2023]